MLQSKNLKVPGSLVGWPKNAVTFVLGLLGVCHGAPIAVRCQLVACLDVCAVNAEANATTKGLDADKLVVSHAAVNQAPKGRRCVACTAAQLNVCKCYCATADERTAPTAASTRT